MRLKEETFHFIMEPETSVSQHVMANAHTFSDEMDTTEAGIYTYELLPGPHFMRLLNVHPSMDLRDPILCSMETVNPETCGAYTALSYSWGMNEDGDTSFCRQIFIDGKVKPVTQNLYEGLCRLRAFENGLRIWIDAICINQRDLEERSAQVSAMASRFADAAKVFVWLGEGNEEQDWFARRAIDYLLDPETRYGEVDMSLHLHYGRLLYELNNLLGKRYFSRLWIVQELLHARKETTTFFWGPCHISRPLFESFVTIWKEWSQYVWDHLEKWDDMPWQILEQGLQKPHTRMENILKFSLQNYSRFDRLPSLLVECKDMHCGEPLDRIYALASLDPDFDIQPDYTISIETLFVRVATIMVNKGLFDYIFNPTETTKPAPVDNTGIPTWVPDLQCLRRGPWIKGGHSDITVNDSGILKYRPYFLGIVTQCFDSTDGWRRRQKPCIVLCPAPPGSILEAIPVTFDNDEFESAQLHDLVCFVSTWQKDAAVQIVRKVPQKEGLYYWVSNFLSYDPRIHECMDEARRVTLEIA